MYYYDNNIIAHHGVLGMKWGVRHDKTSSSKSSTRAAKNAKRLSKRIPPSKKSYRSNNSWYSRLEQTMSTTLQQIYLDQTNLTNMMNLTDQINQMTMTNMMNTMNTMNTMNAMNTMHMM